MLRPKLDKARRGDRGSALVGLARWRNTRSGKRRQTSINFRPFVQRIAKAAIFCAFALVCWGTEISRAQVPDAERAAYAEALAYCRGDVPRPMALRSDNRVLCLDGQISAVSEILQASGLEQGGLFVVRSGGGDIAATISLADMLLTRQATVIVNDYCLSICANYLFIASVKTFVPKDSLVAWINHATGPDNCLRFFETGDRSAPRLQELPCAFPLDARTVELIRLKREFYGARTFSLEEPPEGVAVRRILKRKYDATGRYPDDVYWTWNPRYHAGTIRTNVIYEAYPKSQDEVDATLAQLGLTLSVIYDP
jgi:hypothetical protein